MAIFFRPLAIAATAFLLASTCSEAASAATPTPAQCLAAAMDFDPTNASKVQIIIACDPKNAAQNIARLSAGLRTAPGSGQYQRFSSQAYGAQAYEAGIAQGTTESAAANAFNVIASANAAGQNEAERQAELQRRCAYQGPVTSAGTTLTALANKAPTYTMTQLGILTAILPIFFARCSSVIPPTVPVLSLSAYSVSAGKTVMLTAQESGYSGSFSASSSDAKIATITGTNPATATAGSAQFTVTGGTTPGTVTLTVTDDRGGKSAIALMVT